MNPIQLIARGIYLFLYKIKKFKKYKFDCRINGERILYAKKA